MYRSVVPPPPHDRRHCDPDGKCHEQMRVLPCTRFSQYDQQLFDLIAAVDDILKWCSEATQNGCTFACEATPHADAEGMDDKRIHIHNMNGFSQYHHASVSISQVMFKNLVEFVIEFW